MFIKTRLYIAFATAVLLVLLIGVLSIITFNKQYQQAALVKQSYQVINQLESVQLMLVDMETGQRGFRSSGESKFLQPYRIALPQIYPAIDRLQKSSENSEQQKKSLILKSKVDNLLVFWEDLKVEPARALKAEMVGTLSLEKEKMDEIRSEISELLTIEKISLKNSEIKNLQDVRLAKIALEVGLSLILLVVFLMILIIVKELKNRKKAEESIKENLKNLSEITRESEERNRLLTIVTKVNNVLQGQLSSTSLSGVILETVIKSLDLKAGAFYIYNDETKKIVLTATHSLSHSAKKEYEKYEGFVGQAAAEKEPVVISDIPPEYATFESATLCVGPVHAIYSSLCYQDELKGVLEVMSFRKIDESDIKILKVLNTNISAALYSALTREKVLELFNQIQEQKNILQNQQEELRQTNEELIVQADVLQASEEELRVQEEELRQINAELTEKNQSVENAGKALSIKAKELEVSSKYKSEFLSNMSHELRTPLNSVLILAKLLSDNKEKNLTEKQISHAKIIHKAGNDLLSLINDILDLSKIEAGKVDLHIEEVTMQNIIIDIEQLFSVVAEEKGIQFSINIEKNVPKKIKTDKQKVEQVLKNLLSNAFKFTAKNGIVHLNFTHITDNGVSYVAISVKDSGIGISAAHQQSIFEAFQQADGSTNRKFGGTGLGLSISKELMRMLNGKIKVESEENKGSTFTIYVPVFTETTESITKNNEVKIPAVSSLQEIREQIKISDDRNLANSNNKTLLIIEDDENFASILKDFSIENGYKTIVALSGDEGLLCAKKYKPSAIILDMQLPAIDGWSLINIFENDENLKHIPVHIISAADDVKASFRGAIAVVKKPLEKNDLEKAFTVIGNFLKSNIRKVMIFSENELNKEIFGDLFKRENFEIDFEAVSFLEEAAKKLLQEKYDCFIADIGTDISAGIQKLKEMHLNLIPVPVPTIVVLDNEINGKDELELKKIANVIVRKSMLSISRVWDELELFLHNVNQTDKKSVLHFSNVPSFKNTLQNKKVLVVDDDMRNIFALTAVFEQENMTIFTANDGREALEVLDRNKNVDIVLMDIMMPEMDGYEAMSLIRKKMKYINLPIIALTAKAMSADRGKCIEAGASDYISKPIDTQKLLSLMRVWLS